MEQWKGKVAIVTGASSGIGRAITIKLVEAGMKVAGFARRVDKVKELSKLLLEKPGVIYPVKCDVTKEEDILKAFQLVAEELGTVQVLVNNAGIYRPTTLVDGCTEEWKQVLETNLLGLCICTREAIKVLRGSISGLELPGHIVHINSIWGHKITTGFKNQNLYPASKFGITASAEVLRNELKLLQSRVKVTSISPALVKSDVMKNNGFNPSDPESILFNTAPSLDSDDVADAVLYVLGTKPHVLISELMMEHV